jgi:hypothetical protein
MAQQRTLVLIDDLDGSQAEHTVAFSLDGQQYEIDLSTQNIQRLYETLAPFTTRARTTRTAPPVHRPRAATTAAEPAPPATTSTASAGVTTPDNSSAAAPRPQVPAALFSNPAT